MFEHLPVNLIFFSAGFLLAPSLESVKGFFRFGFWVAKYLLSDFRKPITPNESSKSTPKEQVAPIRRYIVDVGPEEFTFILKFKPREIKAKVVTDDSVALPGDLEGPLLLTGEEGKPISYRIQSGSSFPTSYNPSSFSEMTHEDLLASLHILKNLVRFVDSVAKDKIQVDKLIDDIDET